MASDTSDTPDAILGQEFLTWLWFQSDVAPSFFRTDDGQPFQVSMEKRVTVTGGEGGFAAEEAEMAAKAGAKTVGLGPRILRCETAPLAVLSAVMTLTGNLE